MEDAWNKAVNWLGEKKWRGYCFGFMFSYIVQVFTMVFRRGDTSWYAFDPLRLLNFVLAYVIGLTLYGSVHKYDIVYMKKRMMNVFIALGIIIFLAVVIDLNCHLGLLMWI